MARRRTGTLPGSDGTADRAAAGAPAGREVSPTPSQLFGVAGLQRQRADRRTCGLFPAGSQSRAESRAELRPGRGRLCTPEHGYISRTARTDRSGYGRGLACTVNADLPVISRPTISACIESVPSEVDMPHISVKRR